VTTTSVDSFTSFVRERQQPLLRFAMVLTGQPAEADELVADVFGRCYERWDRISQLDQLNAYVRRMIVNEFISRRRRERKVVPFADLSSLAGATTDLAGDHAERDALLRLLADLPPKQRAAVVLRYYEGLSDDDIAEVMGCRAASVRSNISRAIAALRITIDDPASRRPASPRPLEDF